MILETFLVLALSFLSTKGIYAKVVDNHAVFQKILNEGLYHVTTQEKAEKILSDGIIRASNIHMSLGREKTFFFAGCRTYQELESNCNKIMGRDDLVALKIHLTYEELALNFKERILNDHAIIYEGSYTLPEGRCEITHLSIQRNEMESGKYSIIESKEKLPCGERKSELFYTIHAIPHEICLFGSGIKRVIGSQFKLIRDGFVKRLDQFEVVEEEHCHRK